MAKKGRRPIYNERHRKAIVRALACVDEVFDERSLKAKVSLFAQVQCHHACHGFGLDWGIRSRCSSDAGVEVDIFRAYARDLIDLGY